MDEERIVQRLQIWMDSVETRVDQLAKQVNAVGQVHRVAAVPGNELELRRDLIREVHERGQAYNNVVLSVGYAGFFGLWVIAKDLHWPRLHAIALVGIAVSLCSYIGWEVAQVFLRTQMFRKETQVRGELLGPADHLAIAKGATDRAIALWAYFFYPAVVGAVVGAVSLMWILLANAFVAFT